MVKHKIVIDVEIEGKDLEILCVEVKGEEEK